MLEKDPVAPSVSEETLKAISEVLPLELDELLALSGRIPEDLHNATPQEIALYRRVKEMSEEDQKDLLKQLSRDATSE
jgi:hypothetical protein